MNEKATYSKPSACCGQPASATPGAGIDIAIIGHTTMLPHASVTHGFQAALLERLRHEIFRSIRSFALRRPHLEPSLSITQKCEPTWDCYRRRRALLTGAAQW